MAGGKKFQAVLDKYQSRYRKSVDGKYLGTQGIEALPALSTSELARMFLPTLKTKKEYDELLEACRAEFLAQSNAVFYLAALAAILGATLLVLVLGVAWAPETTNKVLGVGWNYGGRALAWIGYQTLWHDSYPGRAMTMAELAEYDGQTHPGEVYVSIRGRVYDVSRRADIYAAGERYGDFSGEDSTRRFATGNPNDFRGDDPGSMVGLLDIDLQDLWSWENSYIEKYPVIGHIVPWQLHPSTAFHQWTEEDIAKFTFNTKGRVPFGATS